MSQEFAQHLLVWFRPILSAGFKKPKIPTVVLIAKLPTECPSCLKLPCKILFGIDNNVPMFDVKLPVPVLIGEGSLFISFCQRL